MARKNKTFSVQSLKDKDKDNARNRTSMCEPAVRAAWSSLLEDVLMDTGNYHGFGYLDAKDVPVGQRPGIRPSDVPQAERFRDTDETRRCYF